MPELFDDAGQPSPEALPSVAHPTVPNIRRNGGERPTMDERFTEYHAAHPEVLDELVRLLRQASDAGRSRIGVKALFEILRWQRGVIQRDGKFLLNNSLTSRYARLIIDEHPEFESMLETRELRSL